MCNQEEVGIVFASTGGNKMVRALRSLRRIEPDLPVHIVIDVNSRTWKENTETPSLKWFKDQPNVKVMTHNNTSYINGNLNAGVEWLKVLNYKYACLFHDDIIFSPIGKYGYGLLFKSLGRMKEFSALTFSYIQAFSEKDWKRPSAEWDVLDLESRDVWSTILHNAKYVTAPKPHETSDAHEVHFKDFFVQYYIVEKPRRWSRLGPAGQIVSIKTWEDIGHFDEDQGIFYDIQYPAECASRNLPPVWIIPNVPFLHLHNQSIGYADPATGLWIDTGSAFIRKFGIDHVRFWEGKYPCGV